MTKTTIFPILYKYTQTGAVQQWQIFAEFDKFWTEEGQMGGKITTSLPTICTGKNIGKKNETNAWEQALAEAQAKWQKKVDSGYNEVLTEEKKFFEPMLARDAKESKDLTFKVRTFVQPKLDGLRAINENNTLMSRNGKPYVACPHLFQNGTTLDGELYTHQYKDDFNKIVSLCKKQKPTAQELVESAEKVEFWVYDYPAHKGVFSERYQALMDYWSQNTDKFQGIKLVDTFEVNSWEEIKHFHEKFLEKGYEGTIIRLDLGPYENKRSKQLLKYKDFIDEEFTILDAEEGEGGRAGTIGFFWMHLDPSKPYHIDKESDSRCRNVFKSNIKGDFDFLKQVWKDRNKYIGTEATVKYFNRTPEKVTPGMAVPGITEGNKPRFPYIIKLNRKEYE